MTYQCVLAPMYCFVLVGVCVGEALDLTGLAPEETVEIGADFVALAFPQSVALRTSCLRMYKPRSGCSDCQTYLEQVGALLIVPFKQVSFIDPFSVVACDECRTRRGGCQIVVGLGELEDHRASGVFAGNQ